MPPPWASFLRTNSGGNSSTTRNNTPGLARDQSLQTAPDETLESPPPTLIGRDGERATATPLRPRPHTAGTDRHHQHNRSASHPLPRVFARKKSTGNLGGHHTTEPALDEALVPVLDERQSSTPTRVVSGKKTKTDGDVDKVQRRCMCCSSTVKVPKELEKFRCLACLCINDLKPIDEERQERDQQPDGKVKAQRADPFPGTLPLSARTVPLLLERTRTIIEGCIISYLKERCKLEEDRVQSNSRTATASQTPEERENPSLNSVAVDTGSYRGLPLHIFDGGFSSSPLGSPDPDPTTPTISASIKDIFDINIFSYDQTPIHQSGEQATPQSLASPSSHINTSPPKHPERRPPPPPDTNNHTRSQKPRPDGLRIPQNDYSQSRSHSPHSFPLNLEQRRRYERLKVVFRPLEEYIRDSYGDFKSLNSSFSTVKPTHPARARSESHIVTPPPELNTEPSSSIVEIDQLDPKMLLLGDIGENSTWWTGRFNRNEFGNTSKRKKAAENAFRPVSSRSPNVNWHNLNEWYNLIHTAGTDWQHCIDRVKSSSAVSTTDQLEGVANVKEIHDELGQAREHTIRMLLKITEGLLKRPGRPLKEPEDLRWLLIILANPSLYPEQSKRSIDRAGISNNISDASLKNSKDDRPVVPPESSPKKLSIREESQQHGGLLKRTFGLLAGTNDNCHRYLIGWFARFDENHYVKLVDLVASFVTYRIGKRPSRPRSRSTIADSGLIPDLSGSAMSTSAQLHSAMGLSGSVKKRGDMPDQDPEYASDWQVKAAARVMSLLFAANNIWQGKRRNGVERSYSAASTTPQAKAKRTGQLMHTSSFYNTLLDYGDILRDFKVWESKRDKFAFCQYPFFLSMGSKIKILEYDARRQMEIKAREAYFDSVIRQRALDGYFHLRVRRECMVDDSLRQISEAVGGGPSELKKGLRVHFTGEEGVDAGGLRKEWFLMLVRDIFDPNHGMFVYDDDSHICYFNPNSFETSDQYYLVGALLGLAIYNSTILDVSLPPFAFRKLLAAAPAPVSGSWNISSLTGTKGQMTYTLSDLAEFRPSLATGLRKLLEFEGDVQETYCWNFVAPVDRYGTVVNVPLIPGGENKPVTNDNRQAFVDAYIRYLLDIAVSRQFEPFKRGFFQVCAGNALSLFRAEEIELLVRGSDEALDVDSLRAVAVYENWRHFQPPHAIVPRPAEAVPVIQWFWEIFASASPDRQHRLLSFITGTDRIPAVGSTSLVLRIVAGGNGWGGGGAEERARFPVARTCFNMLVLWRYDYREALEDKLWRAVEESEGFGLK